MTDMGSTVRQVEHVLLSAARILRVAEAGERHRDKHLALRFNVLDYLRKGELGLSRIMADLLDPRAGHGQGALFLKTLLRGLAERERERERRPGMENTLREMCTAVDRPAPHILVEKERVIDGDRRIDVSIEIDERRCIAIENKPYSDDQPDQVKDYLAFLRREYADRFLLLYVSAAGDLPSGSSVTKDDLKTHGDRFLVMPYCVSAAGAVSPSDEAPCSSYSIADWAGDCRAHCDVDRLRWFLLDFKNHVRTLGGNGAMHDLAKSELINLLLTNSEHRSAAKAIIDYWLDFISDLITSAHAQLLDILTREYDDIEARTASRGKNPGLWFWRRCWQTYGRDLEDRTRTSVALEYWPEKPGEPLIGIVSPWIGIVSPCRKNDMDDDEKERRHELVSRLHRELHSAARNDWWLWKERLSDDSDDMVQHVVDRFVEIARYAIPEIDKIEGPKR